MARYRNRQNNNPSSSESTAFGIRVDAVKNSDEYKATKARVEARVRAMFVEKSMLEGVEILRARGGWSKIVRDAVETETADRSDDDWGMFGKGNMLREVMLRPTEIADIRVSLTSELNKVWS